MKIEQKLTPLMMSGVACRPNRNMRPASVTIHNTGNAAANALAHAKAQSAGHLAADTIAVHYYVDDGGTVYQCLEDTEQGWHAGDGSNSAGGNATSLAVEICENKGIDFVQACKNAAWLVAGLLQKHQMGLESLRQHHDWTSVKYPTGKDCPYHLRHGTWGVTWTDFLGMVQAELRAEPTAKDTLYTGITLDSLNLRSGPGISYSVRAVIPKGSAVTLKSQAVDGWYEMEFLGVSGYAAANYVGSIMPATQKWYRVQAGAFAQKENAERHLAALRAAGIADAYVTYS